MSGAQTRHFSGDGWTSAHAGCFFRGGGCGGGRALSTSSITGENVVLDVRDVADCHHGGGFFGCNAWMLSAQRIVDAGDVFVDVVHAISCLRRVNAWQKKMCMS